MASGRKGKAVGHSNAQVQADKLVERCTTYLMPYLNNAVTRYDSYIVCKAVLSYVALQIKAGTGSGLLTPSQVDQLVAEFTRNMFYVPDSTN